MSIDVYSYPINLQSLDQKSHRTSLQKAGFASMMDVLNQNEIMNQQDNDAFVVPEESISPVIDVLKPIVEEVSTKEKPIIEDAEVEETIEQAVVLLENIEEQIVSSLAIISPIEIQELPRVEESIEPISTIVFDVPEEVVQSEVMVVPPKKVAPVVMSSPVPVPIATNTIVEVDGAIDIPDVLDKILPEILANPTKKEKSIQIEPIVLQQNIELPLQEIATVLPKRKDLLAPKEAKEKDPDLFSSPQKQIDYTKTQTVQNRVLEEDPKIRFVRYVEEESKNPTFQSSPKELANVPENLLPKQESTVRVQSVPVQPTVVGVERGISQVLNKTEVLQANTILEKSASKEEPLLQKQKIEQSFAKLLKQAQEAAESLEETFHTEVLKKLELHVKDPSGVIQLEIAQKEAMIHIRAVAPVDAMRDLHYLGQDIQGTLQDLGLQLGSYELKSQEEENSLDGFEGLNELGADEIDLEEQESQIIMTNYTIDKRI